MHRVLLCVTLATAFAASPALARSTRVAQIPNGSVAGCGTCHEGTNYAMRNAFGEDVESNLEGTPIESASVAWMTICNLDSDNDGETNGAELGDPCCAWTDGDAPLNTTSLPGDDTSTSGNSCDNGTPVAGEGDPNAGDGDTMSGCPIPGVGGTSLAFMLLGTFGLWRRRRLLSAGLTAGGDLAPPRRGPYTPSVAGARAGGLV